VALGVGPLQHDEAARQARDVDEVARVRGRVDVGPAHRRPERHLGLGRALVARAEDPPRGHGRSRAGRADPGEVAQAVAQLRPDAHEPGPAAVREERPQLEPRGVVHLPVVAPTRGHRRVVDLGARVEPAPAPHRVGDHLARVHLAGPDTLGEQLRRPGADVHDRIAHSQEPPARPRALGAQLARCLHDEVRAAQRRIGARRRARRRLGRRYRGRLGRRHLGRRRLERREDGCEGQHGRGMPGELLDRRASPVRIAKRSGRAPSPRTRPRSGRPTRRCG
jgi:hypothetical protein